MQHVRKSRKVLDRGSGSALFLTRAWKIEGAYMQDNDQPDILANLMPRPGISHWQWRRMMAEFIAAQLEPAPFGVAALYLLGSTKNATAGPASDIDLMVHFRGSDRQRMDLIAWFDSWSRRLSDINYRHTGHKTEGLLDVHIITDADIEHQTSYAAKIGAIDDRALSLKMKT